MGVRTEGIKECKDGLAVAKPLKEKRREIEVEGAREARDGAVRWSWSVCCAHGPLI